MTWRIFSDDNKPKYGDLVVIYPSPEQRDFPYVTVFDKMTQWIDGDMWCKLPNTYEVPLTRRNLSEDKIELESKKYVDIG